MRMALASLMFGLLIASGPVQAGPTTTIGMMADTPQHFDVVLRLSAGLDHQGGLRILPIAGKGGSDWGYSWIPVVGPIIGGVIGALIYKNLWPAIPV